MKTYEISAKNGHTETVLSVNEENFPEILNALMDGFNDITAIDEETGELMYQWYISSEIFQPRCSPFEALMSIL